MIIAIILIALLLVYLAIAAVVTILFRRAELDTASAVFVGVFWLPLAPFLFLKNS